MTKYSIFHPFALSFYSRDLYRDVAANWGAKAFGFLALLLTVCWLAIFIRMHFVVHGFVDRELPRLTDQIPHIEISGGVATSSVPQPYIVADPVTKQPLFVIDTEKKYQATGQDRVFVLTRDKLIVRDRAKERAIDLRLFGDVSLTKESIAPIAHRLASWLVYLGFPIAVTVEAVFRLLQVLLYALIGMIFVQLRQVRIDYEALVHLSVIAITPVILLQTLLRLGQLEVPFLRPICILIALIYLWIGVDATAQAGPLEKNPL
jgi:hypothetical protein